MSIKKADLKNIYIKNFRSFKDLEIHLNKINIIVGRNDNGKSNLIRAIRAYLDTKAQFTDDDRASFIIRRKSETAKIEEIELIGEILYSMNGIEKTVRVRKQNDQYNCEEDTQEDWCQYLPSYKVIDLIDDITNFLNKRFVKIHEEAKSITDHFSAIPVLNVLEEKSHLMKFNNIVDVIMDILEDNKEYFREMDILKELNLYLAEFWIRGSNNSISISNNKIKARDSVNEVDLENRGTGFQSFIYIFIKMLVTAKLLNENNGIILIEEPEKMLHPQAQRDFIKAVEALSLAYENCKFIITTHSPIIVNHSNKGSIMLLQKDKCGITSIKTKSYEHNWKELRGNLGVLPSDSLIFGKVNLIVEGASEYLYIKHLLRKTGIELDLDNISVINAGGATNIEKLVKVTKGEEAIINKIVVLVDGDKEGRDAIRALKKDSLIEDKYIVQLEKSGNYDNEVAFEDIFPKKLRLDALKEVYDLPTLTQEEINDFIKREQIEQKLPWANKIEKYLISKGKNISKIDLCKYMVGKIKSEEINDSIVRLAELLEKIQVED